MTNLLHTRAMSGRKLVIIRKTYNSRVDLADSNMDLVSVMDNKNIQSVREWGASTDIDSSDGGTDYITVVGRSKKRKGQASTPSPDKQGETSGRSYSMAAA